jgi:hypothetical protein
MTYHKNNTTGVSSGAEETAYTLGALELIPGFSGFAQSVVFCVVFSEAVFAFLFFLCFGHCICFLLRFFFYGYHFGISKHVFLYACPSLTTEGVIYINGHNLAFKSFDFELMEIITETHRAQQIIYLCFFHCTKLL